MNALQERILRACLKPAVECDLPGRLRLRFARADRLPEQALPYLHYIPEVMQLLPGVGEVSCNVRIGTVLVKYDAQKVSAERILEWIGAVVDEGTVDGVARPSSSTGAVGVVVDLDQLAA